MAEFAGVASSLELFGISRYIVVPLAAAVGLAAGRAGHLQTASRRSFSSRRASTSATSSPACWRIRTGKPRRSRPSRRPETRRHPQLRLSLHADRAGRHDDRAVDAVLSAGVGRREGRHGPAVPRLALGRDRRLPVRAVVAWFIIVACAATLHASRTSPRSATRPTPRRRCGRWPANTRTCCLRPACSTPRCSPRRFCRSRRRTRCAKDWASSPASTRSFTKRRSSTGSTRCSSSPAPACCWCRGFPLAHIMVLSQVVNGVVLPFVLIFMLLLTNDRELMGEHVNSRVQHRRVGHGGRDDRADARHAADPALRPLN